MAGTEPATGDAHLQAALAAHRAGDAATARAAYLRHLDAAPGDARAWCALGSLEGEAGRHDQAERAYRRALAEAPSHGPAHAGLGVALLMQARPAEAAPALTRARELAPGDDELGLQLALAWRRAGEIGRAVAVLHEMAAEHPGNHRIRYNLGLALLEAGDAAAAARTLQALAGQAGPRPQVLAALGRALAGLHRLDEAADALERARDAAPADPGVLVALGGVRRRQGRLEEAAALYRSLLGPDRSGPPAAVVGLAEVRRLEGEPEAGLELLSTLPEEAAHAPQAVATEAKLLLDCSRPEQAVTRIEAGLATTGLAPDGRAGLNSLLGRALDRLGRHEAAWGAWTAAVGDRREAFDPGHFETAIDRLIEAYDAALFRSASSAAGWEGPQPLLLVGPPRSGKSILEQMLACHPAVMGGGELRLLGGLTEAARRTDPGAGHYPDCMRRLPAGDLSVLAARYARGLAEVAGDARLVTDTQPTNFLHVGLAALLCPDVRVVDCRRDPLDTAWACYGHRFADPALAFVATPEGIARYLGGQERLMAHWSTLWPERLLRVDYEALVADPEAVLRRVLGFVALPFSPACLRYWEPGRARLASPPAVTRPLDRSEVGRGRPYRARFAAVLEAAGDGPSGG